MKPLTTFALALTLLAPLFSSVGCNSAGGAFVGGAAVLGLGVPLLTHSHVDVRVETFDESLVDPLTIIPSIYPNPDRGNPFYVPQLAIQLQMKSAIENKRRLSLQSVPTAALVQYRTELESAMQNWNAPSPTTNADNAAVKQLTEERTKAFAAFHSFSTNIDSAHSTKAPAMKSLAIQNLWEVQSHLKSAQQIAARVSTTDPTFVSMVPSVDLGILSSDLLSDQNNGAIIREVMQEVLSVYRPLDIVLDERNSDCWKPMNIAVSDSGTGNHDAIIYLENTATPMLKSAKFNPDKFTEAFGQVFQTAFSAAATAFGVPGGGASGAAAAGTSGSVAAADQRAKDAQSLQSNARGAMLDALDAVVKANGPLTAANPSADDLKAAEKALRDMALKLADVPAK